MSYNRKYKYNRKNKELQKYKKRTNYGSKQRQDWMKTGANVASTAYSAYKMAKLAYSLINPEFKINITTRTAAAISADSPTFQCLTNMAQGTDDTNRIGKSILCKSLSIRYFITRQSSQDAVMRIIIFVDTAGQGVTPSITDLLTSSSTVSGLNTENGKRFTVLRDWFFPISNGSSTLPVIKDHIKLQHHAEFDGTDGTVGSTTNGHVWVLWLSNVAAAGNPPLGTSNIVFRYIDN